MMMALPRMTIRSLRARSDALARSPHAKVMGHILALRCLESFTPASTAGGRASTGTVAGVHGREDWQCHMQRVIWHV